MKIHAEAFIGLTGQEISSFQIPWEGACPSKSEIRIEGPAVENGKNAYLKKNRGYAPGEVQDAVLEEGCLKIEVIPVTTRPGMKLRIGEQVFDQSEFEIHTRTADEKFSFHEEGRLMYRLYSPETEEKRPMILFLHGGGNGGYEGERDNQKHILTDYGPVNFAEDYPDVYVLAPMCVEAHRDMKNFNPNMRFADSDQNQIPGYGWCREYLALVCDLIRRMIREGKVDEKRIYVTGMSMGGAGTIRAMSVGADLFTACVPVCPTMTPETFSILKSLRMPVWVTSAYIDHTLYRHKYLVDAVMALRDAGNREAHLTLFSPEELEKYDISIDPELSYKQKFSENHASWVPTYKNEYGIMSWLLNQVKK